MCVPRVEVFEQIPDDVCGRTENLSLRCDDGYFIEQPVSRDNLILSVSRDYDRSTRMVACVSVY